MGDVVLFSETFVLVVLKGLKVRLEIVELRLFLPLPFLKDSTSEPSELLEFLYISKVFVLLMG